MNTPVFSGRARVVSVVVSVWHMSGIIRVEFRTVFCVGGCKFGDIIPV